MKRVKYNWELWCAYMRVGFLTMTQYPADTIIMLISMLVREASGFIGILTIAGVTGGVGNWNIYEVCILFSMCAVIEAIGQAFFDNVWGLDYIVRKGELDVFLTRPASIVIQMLGKVMHFQAVLSMFIYIGIFVWAAMKLSLVFGPYQILILAEYVIFGTMVNSGIYMIFNCLNFWIVQGEDIAVLVQTCREFVKYPLNVFPAAIQGFFTFLLPLGFVAYYPAMALLGKTSLPVPVLMPVVAAVVILLAALIWNAGLRGYNSTGT
nr:ABC-2 family transporter protein [uncultured Merdimonas sp.]